MATILSVITGKQWKYRAQVTNVLCYHASIGRSSALLGYFLAKVEPGSTFLMILHLFTGTLR